MNYGGLPRSAHGGFHGMTAPFPPGVHHFLSRLFRCHAISAVLSFNFVLKRMGFGYKRITFPSPFSAHKKLH